VGSRGGLTIVYSIPSITTNNTIYERVDSFSNHLRARFDDYCINVHFRGRLFAHATRRNDCYVDGYLYTKYVQKVMESF